MPLDRGFGASAQCGPAVYLAMVPPCCRLGADEERNT